MSICVEQRAAVTGFTGFEISPALHSWKPQQQSSFSVKLKRLLAAIFT